MEFTAIRACMIKAGLISSACREVGPYYYSRNTGVRKQRSAGHVALFLRKIYLHNFPTSAGSEITAYPVGSWASNWPKTVRATEAENVGDNNFWRMAEALATLWPPCNPLQLQEMIVLYAHYMAAGVAA